MKNRIYAMDTHFMCDNSGTDVPDQVEMVKAAGYDGYYVTALHPSDFHKVKRYREETHAVGLDFNSLLVLIDIGTEPSEQGLERFSQVLADIDHRTILEVCIQRNGFSEEGAGDPAHDRSALRWLELIVSMTAAKNIECALYPHFGFWLETASDCLRLIRQLNAPNVGLVFCAYHWYRISRESLAPLMAEAAPFLREVNLNGSRFLKDGEKVENGLNPTIEPLDSGDLDNAAIITELKRIDFHGPIGVQGFGVKVPAQEALTRSAAALRRLLED